MDCYQEMDYLTQANPQLQDLLTNAGSQRAVKEKRSTNSLSHSVIKKTLSLVRVFLSAKEANPVLPKFLDLHRIKTQEERVRTRQRVSLLHHCMENTSERLHGHDEELINQRSSLPPKKLTNLPNQALLATHHQTTR